MSLSHTQPPQAGFLYGTIYAHVILYHVEGPQKKNLPNEYVSAVYSVMIFVAPTGLPLVPGPMAARTHSKLTRWTWGLTGLKEAVW